MRSTTTAALRTAALMTAVVMVGACATPRRSRAPSSENLRARVELTTRLVEIHEQHLAYVTAQFENGVVSQADVSAAEIALIDARLRRLAAEALVEMGE